jgi:hypothetical protein
MSTYVIAKRSVDVTRRPTRELRAADILEHLKNERPTMRIPLASVFAKALDDKAREAESDDKP